MDPKNQGLVDNQEGDIILNESGTSVKVDDVAEENTDRQETTVNKDGDASGDKLDPENKS